LFLLRPTDIHSRRGRKIKLNTINAKLTLIFI